MSEAQPDPLDRLSSAFLRLVKLTFPALRFAGVYEYALVSGAAGPKLTARCTDSGLGMPDIADVSLLPSVDGGTATWITAGTTFLVLFANCDPTRPRAVNGDPSRTPATVSFDALQTITIGGVTPGTLPPTTPGNAARVGDAVGPFLVTSGSTKTKVGG